MFHPFMRDRGLILGRDHQLRNAPNAIRNASFHCGPHPKAGIQPAEIIIGKMQRDGCFQVRRFLTESVRQSRVNLRIAIRLVKFCRSTKLVEMCSGLGAPAFSDTTLLCSRFLVLCEVPVEKLAKCCATVAVLRLFFRRQFCEGLLNGRKVEQRVIPESTRAPGRVEE
jgi:hypothetical protein